MNIHLKQAELDKAIKMYIASQGINLTGKQIDIKYTATRTGGGITADIALDEPEDGDVVGGTEVQQLAEKLYESVATTGTGIVKTTVIPLSEVVKPTSASKSVKEIAQAAVNAVLPEDGEQTPAAEPTITNLPLPEDAEVKPVKTTSLFS